MSVRRIDDAAHHTLQASFAPKFAMRPCAGFRRLAGLPPDGVKLLGRFPCGVRQRGLGIVRER